MRGLESPRTATLDSFPVGKRKDASGGQLRYYPHVYRVTSIAFQVGGRGQKSPVSCARSRQSLSFHLQCDLLYHCRGIWVILSTSRIVRRGRNKQGTQSSTVQYRVSGCDNLSSPLFGFSIEELKLVGLFIEDLLHSNLAHIRLGIQLRWCNTSPPDPTELANAVLIAENGNMRARILCRKPDDKIAISHAWEWPSV
jgi:hypothetical protein